MDRLTKVQRSLNMSHIRSKNTRPEKLLFSLLRKSGYRFTRHSNLPGKPDIVFKTNKIALFIDGEFWHGKDFKNWKDKLSPFWLKKIGGNIKRDRKNDRILRKSGWHIVHLWGREIEKNSDKSIEKIKRFIWKNRNDG